MEVRTVTHLLTLIVPWHKEKSWQRNRKQAVLYLTDLFWLPPWQKASFAGGAY